MRLYLLGGAAIAVLALLSGLLWQLHSTSSALSASEASALALTGERDRAVAINESNTAALAELARLRAIDSAQIKQLAVDFQVLEQKTLARAAERKQIAESNPEVKAFLDTPVPTALRMRKSAN